MRGRGAEKRFRNLNTAPCGAPLRRFWALSPSLSGSNGHRNVPEVCYRWRPAAGSGCPIRLNRRSLRQAHSCGPVFRRVGRSCRKPPVPRDRHAATKDQGATPAPSPDSSVCTPGLSMTGQGEISMGGKVLDKFSDIPAIPDAARHAMLRCWSGTHQQDRNWVDPVSAPHH